MPNTYTASALQQATGLSAHAIRHLIKQGLLPRALSAGTGAHYTEEHLRLARRIVELRREGVHGGELAPRLRAEAKERARAAAQGIAAPTPPALRDAVDALVCAGAEALDVSPRALRAALAIVWKRMHERGIDPGAAAAIVASGGA